MSSKITWIIIGVIAVAVGGFFGIRYIVRQSELSEFTARLAEYSALPTNTASPEPRPYITKSIIPVDVRGNKIDWFYYDLPDDMRAKTPADVGTVVRLEWGEDKVGDYGAGGGAYVRTCVVTVVDHGKRTVVGQSMFRGGDPPPTSRRGASAYGSYPTEQMVAYLKNMPRK